MRFTLELDDSKVVDSDELKPGIVVDFNANKQVAGIEVLDFKRRVLKADLKQLKALVADYCSLGRACAPPWSLKGGKTCNLPEAPYKRLQRQGAKWMLRVVQGILLR